MNLDFEQIRWALLTFVALILCISLHEFGHAWMANRRGDPLPRLQGRVTIDPRAHIDPLGTLLIPGIMILAPAFFGAMPFAIFGWGKPVQISLMNPKTRKQDDIFITLAGPGMNFILALASAIVLGVLGRILISPDTSLQPIAEFFGMFLMLNIVLMIFNLIPFPPLDGSRLMFYAIKMREDTYNKIARNAWWIMLLAINLPSPGNSIVSNTLIPLISIVIKPFIALAEFISTVFR